MTITDVLPTSCQPIKYKFTISEPSIALGVNLINLSDADCAGQNTGSITIDVIGGTPDYVMYPGVGYDIVWSIGATATETISGLSPGNYSLIITDGEGCTYNNVATPFVVDQLSDISLVAPATIVNNTCNGENEGSIYVKVTGGSTDYEFRLEGTIIVDWSKSVSATLDDFNFIDLPEGNYNIKVRDINNVNCEYNIGNYTISDPAALTLVTMGTTDVTCFGQKDGTISVRASGGSGSVATP